VSAPSLRLTGRSSSHFTRVAAMFAHELGLAFEAQIVEDLTSLDPTSYGGQPALKVPVLRVGEVSVFGTENICRKLAALAGRADDERVVLAEHVADDLVRNAQELVWHAMAAQVQLRMGIAVAQLPADNVFFAKAWLDEHLEEVLRRLPAPRDLSVLEVTLFCLVEHIAFRPTVDLAPYPALRTFARRFGERGSARRTVFRLDEGAR
jgi:glutathione S-transferase